MIFNLNNFDYKHAKLILANPQKQKIGLIGGVKELSIAPYFNSITEIEFKIYKTENGKKNPYYSKIKNDGRLILVKGVAWFQILSANEEYEKNSPIPYKKVKCLTLENELIYRKISNINGVFCLYDSSDKEHSLGHIIESECGWHFRHVDSDLVTQWRTFSIDSEKIYNLLTTNISKSFNCIFQFDTFEKAIDAFKLESLGELTDIVISDRNVLTSYVKESDLDKIATKIRARGGSNFDGTQFDFRGVNPTGMDYLVNLDYYLSTEYMSQGLIDSYKAYQSKLDSYSTQYTTTLNTLKQYNAELTTFKSQLYDIEAEIKTQQNVIGVSVQSHSGNIPSPTDTDYEIYQNANTLLNQYLTQKAIKQSEMNAKQTQITNTRNILDNMSVDLSMSGNFTSEQLEELVCFIKEGEEEIECFIKEGEDYTDELECFIKEGEDYTDETYCISENMTDEEAIELKLEFMNVVKNELARISRPQYTIKTTISNLYLIQDGLDQKISYDKWKSQFSTGNIITLKFRDDYALQVRLMSMNINTDNMEDIEVVFSDKSRLDDSLIQIGEVIAQANRTATSYSLAKMGYDAASKQTSTFKEFQNGVLNATYNQMVSDDNAQVSIDKYGIRIREWIEDANAYSPYQMWLNYKRMLFSNDGFKSADSAFGLLNFPDGSQGMGINTEFLIGNIGLFENLFITNEKNTITMNKDGAIFKNCSIEVTNGLNTIKLNPNNGLQIYGGSKLQFFADYNGDINFSGNLRGAKGTFSGTLSGNTITGATINGGTINGGIINGSLIKSVYAGEGNDTVTLEMTDVSFGVYVTQNNVVTASSYLTHTGLKTQTSSSSAEYTRSGINLESYGTSYFSADSNGVRVNGSSVITYSNVGGSHTHSYLDGVGSDVTLYSNALRADSDNSLMLGSPSYRWSTVYASSSTISTSDKTKKKNIAPMTDKQLEFFKLIIPVTYQFIDGTSGRTHYGFVSQDIEIAMQKCGLTSLDFAGFIKSPKYSKIDEETGEYDVNSEIVGYDYFLRYEEFIALNTYIIQQQQSRIEEIERRLILLENI